MSEEIKCEAFGDESTASGERFAIYSFIGFSPKGVEVATSTLSELKRRFGVPDSARLHCRVLFSGDQRAKTEWSVLHPKDTAEFCRQLSIELLPLTPIWSYGYLDLWDLNGLPHPGVLSGKFSTDDGREFSMRFRVKEAQKQAYGAAEIPIVLRFLKTVRFWIDQDSSKIDSMDGKRQQAHNVHNGLGAPAQIQLPEGYAPMLEIADLFAYTASRNLSMKQQFGQSVFKMIHERFRPIVNKMTMNPNLFGSAQSTSDWLNANQHSNASTSPVASPASPSEP